MGWQGFCDMMAELTPLSMCLRMLFATLIGALVGFDRRLRNNSAGMRTHALGCVGSALTMMLSQYIALRYPAFRIDVSRIGSGVVGGVGFLGAGTIIMTEHNRVHGLSTAAGIWACSCIGLSAGMGFVEGTLIATVFVLFALYFLRLADRKLVKNVKYIELYLEFEDQNSVREFTDMAHEQDIKITDFQLRKGISKGDGPTATVSVELPSFEARKPFLKSLKEAPGVRYFHIV